MNKDFARKVKTYFPYLFNLIERNFFFLSIATELDRPRYIYAKLMGQPYFGSLYLASHTWPERKEFMKMAVRSELQNNQNDESEFCMIEIGSWAGESAVLWANEIRSYGGKLLCIDSWEPYKIKQIHKGAMPALVDKLLMKNVIFNLFMHNVKTSGNDETIIPMKSFSADMLPRLKNSAFNMIYLDGGHDYSTVYKDLNDCGILLKEGGLLCGDDLEIQYHQIKDKKLLHQDKNAVFIRCEETGTDYHPGVTHAVYDFFNCEVSNYNGFWIMRKVDGSWERVDLQ